MGAGGKSIWKTKVPSGSPGLVLWHIAGTSKNVIEICTVVLIKITAFITTVMLTANAALVWSVSVEHDIQYYFPFGQHRRCWLSVVKDSHFLLSCYKKLLFIIDLALHVFFSPGFYTKNRAAAFLKSLVQFERIVNRYLGVIMAFSNLLLCISKLSGRVYKIIVVKIYK